VTLPCTAPTLSKLLRCSYARKATPPVTKGLNAWLRNKGVNTQKPLHTLRKEYGSLVSQAHGIHAASKALRHADIHVTNNYYTDARVRVTPGLGKLFGAKKKRQKK